MQFQGNNDLKTLDHLVKAWEKRKSHKDAFCVLVNMRLYTAYSQIVHFSIKVTTIKNLTIIL